MPTVCPIYLSVETKMVGRQLVDVNRLAEKVQ